MRQLQCLLRSIARRREICEALALRQRARNTGHLSLPVIGMALFLVSCASHSLVSSEQAAAIRQRERALAPHAAAIQEAIRRSDSQGALVFLDSADRHLVVLPGNSPVDAWANRASAAA